MRFPPPFAPAHAALPADTVEISGPTAGATLALLRAARAWPSKRHLRLRDFEFYHNGAWRALGRDLGPRALDSVTCDLPSAQNFRKYAEFTMRALHITSFSPEHGFHLRADHPMRAIEIRHAAARCCHPAFLRLRRDTAESRTAAAGPDAAGLALAQQPFDQWPPVRAAAIDSIVFPQHQYATHVDTLALVFWSLLPTIHDGPIADHVERTRPRRLLVHEIDSDTVHTLLVRDRRDTLAFLRSAASSRDGHARHWRLFKSYQHREPSYLAVDSAPQSPAPETRDPPPCRTRRPGTRRPPRRRLPGPGRIRTLPRFSSFRPPARRPTASCASGTAASRPASSTSTPSPGGAPSCSTRDPPPPSSASSSGTTRPTRSPPPPTSPRACAAPTSAASAFPRYPLPAHCARPQVRRLEP